MFFVKYRRWFFALSALLLLGSVFCLVFLGLNFGPDFTGGAVLEITYLPDKPALPLVRDAVAKLNLGTIAVQEIGAQGYVFRSRALAETERQTLLNRLRQLTPAKSEMTEKRFNSVGPTLGRELARKGIIAIVIVILLILFYIALVFHKVSRPVSSWVYGLVAVLTMFHDTLIPVGIFSLLGKFWGVEIDALSLTALLTILGLSVNDKIVALDRIRENVRGRGANDFPATVGRSLDETLARSINTSLTILLVLIAIVIFGGDSTRYFALAMALGMLVATYSSIFIAAPLLVTWQKRRFSKGNP